MKKKLILIAIANAMIFSAASCSVKIPKSGDVPQKIANIAEYDGNFRAEKIEVPAGVSISAVPLNDGFLTAVIDEKGNLNFYTSDGSFGNFTLRDIGIDKHESSEIRIEMCGGADNSFYIAVTENVGADYPEYVNTLYHVNSDFTVAAKTPLTDIGEVGINGIIEHNGQILVSSDSVYSVSDNNGSGVEMGDEYGNGAFGILSDGSFCNSYIKNDSTLLKISENTIDISQCGLPTSNITSSDRYDAVFAANDGIYAISGDSVFKLAENVMLGLEVGSIYWIYSVGEDLIISAYDYRSNCSNIYRITEAEEDEIHEEVTLKMGVFYEEMDFSSFLSQLNGSDSYVKIEPVYYTQFDVYDKDADKQISTGLDQLNIDLISGNAPDMAVFMDMPQYLPSKGVFTDLYDIMDDELDRDDFLPNVLEACEYNGKLYSLPSSFSINSLVCKEKYSTAASMNFDEMLEIYGSAPEGTPFVYDSVDSWVFLDMISFSDFAASFRNGNYIIDTDNMKRIMEFCGSFGSDNVVDDTEPYESKINRVLFNSFQAYKFTDFSQYIKNYDEPVNFIGYPSENGGTLINPINTVAVLDSCKDKEAAWEVIKCMYGNTSITNGMNAGFPPISKTFYSWADNAKLNMDEEICDQAVKVVESANSFGSSLDHALMSIISEEVARYFHGECTADEAVEMIKNRTDIYVSERS